MKPQIPQPFQDEGADWLTPKAAALLADEMGLGKTLQAVEAARRVGAERITVTCPAVAKHNWRRVFDAQFQGAMSILPVDTRTRFAPPAQIEIYSYDFIVNDPSCRAQTRKGDVLITDESHYLANHEAQRTRELFGDNLDRRGDCVANRSYEHVWALSGTPMRRDPSSLWPLLHALAPERIAMNTGKPMPHSAFISMFCEGFRPKGRNRFVITGGKNLDRLASDLDGFFLRRRADDLGLPPIVFDEHELVVDKWSLPGFLTPPDGVDDDEEFLREVRNLGDQAKWRKELGVVKARASAHLIQSEFKAMLYDKIVVFAWHSEALDVLENLLRSLGVLRIDGSTSTKQREEKENLFNNSPEYRVMLGQIEAAGTSLTLTAANHEFFVELDWTTINNAQAAMRTRRIGQSKTSFCRMATTPDPMDARLTSVLLRKTKDEVALFGESVSSKMAEALQ